MRLIVNEYPKSGGSWLVNLLGDTLGLPKKDIYIGDGYDLFDITKHPWYEGEPNLRIPESAVIKSHELPESKLNNSGTHFVHLIRDGRDVIVSRYFFESEFLVKNGVLKSFDEPFDDYVPRVAKEWVDFVSAWWNTKWVSHITYEHLVFNPFIALNILLCKLNLDYDLSKLNYAIENNTPEKFRASLSKTFTHNTFVRKAIVGDFKNYFEQKHLFAFDKIAKNTMKKVGYYY